MVDIIEIFMKRGVETALTLISGASALMLKKVWADYKREKKEQQVLKVGMIALLHDSLFRNCETYLLKGEITVSELNNLTKLYESYHALGGNGTGTAIYERCKSLPLKPDSTFNLGDKANSLS